MAWPVSRTGRGQSGACGARTSTHDHDGAGGVGRDGRGHRAQAGGGEVTAAAGADDDEVRASGHLHENLGGGPGVDHRPPGTSVPTGPTISGCSAWNSPHVRRSACRVIKARAAAAGLRSPIASNNDAIQLFV